MASVAARLVRRGTRALIKAVPTDDRMVAEMRRRVGSNPSVTRLGRHVGHRPIQSGELGSAEGEWVGVPAARRHLLYFHGGAYVSGQPETYRNLAGRLADGLDADVALVRYRLAPEHPYPAALDDAVGAYRGLLARGIDPVSTAIAGDSAGGGLTLAALLRIRDESLPLPGAGVLLSPWTDLTCSGASMATNAEADDMVGAEMLRRSAELYGAGTDLADPGLSPLLGDVGGLPPLLVTVDTSEVLLDDARRLAARVTDAGGRLELVEATGLLHVWPILVPYLPEARRTVARIVAFLDAALA